MIVVLLLIGILCYTFFSYAFTDPNLLLLQAEWYQRFQQTMWETFFHNRPLTAWLFVVFLVFFFLYYFVVLVKARKWQSLPVQALFVLVPLIISYNALSHDVFNYAFNAKMVVAYGANPHQKVALDFAQMDDWLRFMHNTHTPAPYGYGWTVFSLLPYIISGGKFFITWIGFKTLSFVSVVVLFFVLEYYSKQKRGRSLTAFEQVLVFANPLLYLETVSNAHNDLWMMSLSVFSFALMYRILIERKNNMQLLVVSGMVLLFSISVKLVTVLLIPFWLLLLALYCKKQGVIKSIENRLPSWIVQLVNSLLVKGVRFLLTYLEDGIALVLLIPLLTSRSQQFLPWYLMWALVWMPFTKSVFIRVVLITLSVSSMFRYLPWILEGGYSAVVHSNELAITWIPFVIILCIYCIVPRFRTVLTRVLGTK